ncbi:MAG: bifunctional tetrahydrofolate synthase/dihydrofolate synthase [Pseudomonadota bacterium]
MNASIPLADAAPAAQAPLSDWLHWLEAQHPRTIELGLERVGQVADRLGLRQPFSGTIISIAGTNGKGSSVALLQAALQAAGLSVGAYTSPHLEHYAERIRIDGQPVSEAALTNAFARIESARQGTPLTYFEFGTLAALLIFRESVLDVLLLEVGMGGRLDAVNCVDADIALITNIALDHQEWLGEDIETIAGEKAGILRAGRPVVFSGAHCPGAIVEETRRLGCPLYRRGEAFNVRIETDGWSWHGPHASLENLPHPALAGTHQIDNAAGVLMVLSLLEGRGVPREGVRQALTQVRHPGRFECFVVNTGNGAHEIILDVAHNPDGARALAETLAQHPPRSGGRTLALCAVLTDKDADGLVEPLLTQVAQWVVCGLSGPRGDEGQRVQDALLRQGVTQIAHEARVEDGYNRALTLLGPDDRLVVFGSFLTVAEVRKRVISHAG